MKGPASDAFIRKALQTWTKMAAAGKTNREVAAHIGCHPSMLHYWNSIAPVKGWPLGPVRMQNKGAKGNSRHHSEEFKHRAVSALLNRGELTVVEVARGLRVSAALLYRWMRLSGIPNTKVGHARARSHEKERARIMDKIQKLRAQLMVLGYSPID